MLEVGLTGTLTGRWNVAIGGFGWYVNEGNMGLLSVAGDWRWNPFICDARNPSGDFITGLLTMRGRSIEAGY